jgi:hypothetical protein
MTRHALAQAVLLALYATLHPADSAAQSAGKYVINKGQIELDARSGGRIALENFRAGTIQLDPVSAPDIHLPFPPIPLLGADVQVNDPKLDSIQIFPGTRPFVNIGSSETSVSAFGANVVAVHNASGTKVVNTTSGLVIQQLFGSGYSFSRDNGITWKSAYMPPLPGSAFTLGDPVIDRDRFGNFYFSGLGLDAAGNFAITFNKSTDGGRTFGPAVPVALDEGGDKEWIAVGPDPKVRGRDNVYITWTSFQDDGSIQLKLAKSIDGGATWTTKTAFAPPADPDPTKPQNALQFSTPVVDRSNGKLYIAFLNFSNADQDFIRLLVSDDGGDSFRLASFNLPGSPDPTLIPVTQPGTATECGVRIVTLPDGTNVAVPNLRLTIHDGADVGGSLTGFPRFVQANRLVAQPQLAVAKGSIYLAWTTSTSATLGDLNSGANVFFIRSRDGGLPWSSPVRVNPGGPARQRNVMPALSIGRFAFDVDIPFTPAPDTVSVLYYSQSPSG